MLGLLLMVGAGPAADSPSESIARGRRAFAEGDDAAALASVRLALAARPDAPLANYDVAATLYRLNRFPEAASFYRKARVGADPTLKMKIDYALGNTALRLGEVEEAIRHYDACLASRAVGAALDRVRADAAINRQFAIQNRPRGRPDSGPDPPGKGEKPDPSPKSRPPDDPKKEDRPSESPKSSPSPGSPPPPADSNPAKAADQPRSGGSPDERLADALKSVREAMPRPPEPGGEGAKEGDRKDW